MSRWRWTPPPAPHGTAPLQVPTRNQTRDGHPMMVWRWSRVCDAGPTLNQHWVNVLCFSPCHLCSIHWHAGQAANIFLLPAVSSELHANASSEKSPSDIGDEIWRGQAGVAGINVGPTGEVTWEPGTASASKPRNRPRLPIDWIAARRNGNGKDPLGCFSHRCLGGERDFLFQWNKSNFRDTPLQIGLYSIFGVLITRWNWSWVGDDGDLLIRGIKVCVMWQLSLCSPLIVV